MSFHEPSHCLQVRSESSLIISHCDALAYSPSFKQPNNLHLFYDYFIPWHVQGGL